MLAINTVHPNFLDFQSIKSSILMFGKVVSTFTDLNIQSQKTSDGHPHLHHQLLNLRKNEFIVDVTDCIPAFDKLRTSIFANMGPQFTYDYIQYLRDRAKLDAALTAYHSKPPKWIPESEKVDRNCRTGVDPAIIEALDREKELFGMSDHSIPYYPSFLMQSLILRQQLIEAALVHCALDKSGFSCLRTLTFNWKDNAIGPQSELRGIVLKSVPVPNVSNWEEIRDICQDGLYIERIHNFRKWITSKDFATLSADEATILINEKRAEIEDLLRREKIAYYESIVKIVVSHLAGAAVDLTTFDVTGLIKRPFEIVKDIRDISTMESSLDKHELGAFYGSTAGGRNV